ncbi:hypothetical protein B6N60_03004 [Richelia sinica FACHB-800]|jgi:hypothetical protein|uniref:Uncharacterized protein n=1 Tax=Richelia sinica FACHB-800 TaxID=1357546 RepID=A0A975Y5J4_9NOST|nr:hypothetical protein [Richelia sinica]MBD2665054.1 hypothetical protein [Richelia sinica FACHB-800]QXE24300.1 hypothetical protein B6N60_03004 [Richelia sinica FACHB-800]
MSSLKSTFIQHLDISSSQLENILSLSLNDLLKSPQLQQELNSLNIKILKATLPTCGAVLAQELPPFYHWLKNELGVKRVPDTPDHTTKWVIGFVNNQESLTRLVELHRQVPRPALEASIPRLVDMFAGVEDEQTRQEWQKAIAVLCLVLVVASREQERLNLAAS